MNYLTLFLGIGIILTAVYDLAFTTFSPDGAGVFTDFITKRSYNIFRRISSRTGSKKILEIAGTVSIGVILTFWYLSIWLGGSLIICSDPGSVVNSDTLSPASVAEKIYYTGFTLSTLGVGDFNAGTDGWRIFTILLSFIGFALITTGISYMVPVLSASVNQRKLGNYISILGNNPQDILFNHWREGNFEGLEKHFGTLTEMIVTHSQQIAVYPVLYCFYTEDPRKAGLLNLFRMDEALTILLLDIPAKNRPNEQSIRLLRESITYYLTIRKEFFSGREPEEPDIPQLNSLKKTGIPLLHDQDGRREAYKEFSARRKLLTAILKDQGRSFGDVYRERTEHRLDL